ncbi:hypothetical protein F2Q69_00027125 [Brassica cretica]|uniref:Uncharacterized protein n=1 Tax=Brassica cretica TaxID=69181 RepID=A0A8S9RT69_BRACR|nr:hypothetical protein F2Q69_00027125 [Brassica cretica]
MGKTSSTSVWVTMQKKRWPLMILLFLSVSTVGMILVRSAFDSCSISGNRCGRFVVEKQDSSDVKIRSADPLGFMKSKLVLLVSHELSLSGYNSRSFFTSESWVELKFSSFQVKLVFVVLGGPLLLMELAFLLRGVGAEVVWTTNQKPVEADEVVNVLEHKMLDRGVKV